MNNDSAKINPALKAVKDHSRHFTGYTFVYPVISRRAHGLSLGVNLNPDKKCNFDCIYCEVDRRTPGLALRVDLEQLGIELADLIRQIKAGGLKNQDKFNDSSSLAQEIRDIAFSGDGEPTLAPNFSACVQRVADIKQREALTTTKIVLITNATGLDKADVQAGLKIMDQNQGEIWGKLDAGSEAYYRQVNRAAVQFDRILNNLLITARVRPIVIQSLFLKVHGQSIAPAELAVYCQRLNRLIAEGAQIKELHAYTIARPTPEPFATKLEAPELESIAQVIRQQTGLTVETFA